MNLNLTQYLRKKVINYEALPIKKNKFNGKLKIINIRDNFKLNFFGNKNKNKFFYVIRRSPGSGLFSNLTYVLNHLKIADKYKFIPVVDMENFLTIYSCNEN